MPHLFHNKGLMRNNKKNKKKENMSDNKANTNLLFYVCKIMFKTIICFHIGRGRICKTHCRNLCICVTCIKVMNK